MKPNSHTIQQFNREFPDNVACLEYLFQSRFPSHTCPKCGRVGQYHRQEDTSHYVCACGGHQLSPKKDTIFEKSDTDLYKWFFAMFLMSNAKNGVAAKEIERQVGVTYKTAWRMARLIRMLMEQELTVFDGIVEADETYIGSRRHGVRVKGRGTKKTPVVGVAKRGGGLVTKATSDVGRSTVMKIVKDHVKVGSRLMTDEFPVYSKASKSFIHETVQHGKKEYVRGKVHTNTIEGVWSQIKRGIGGTHHAVSSKHLQTYLDFYTWQWNHRNASKPLFFELLEQVAPQL